MRITVVALDKQCIAILLNQKRGAGMQRAVERQYRFAAAYRCWLHPDFYAARSLVTRRRLLECPRTHQTAVPPEVNAVAIVQPTYLVGRRMKGP
jgi:hypothetical protein